MLKPWLIELRAADENSLKEVRGFRRRSFSTLANAEKFVEAYIPKRITFQGEFTALKREGKQLVPRYAYPAFCTAAWKHRRELVTANW